MTRLRYPFCAATDQTRFRPFAIEEGLGMRLELGDACRRFLKIRTALRGEAEADSFARDLATLHLDALPRGRGDVGAWPAPA